VSQIQEAVRSLRQYSVSLLSQLVSCDSRRGQQVMRNITIFFNFTPNPLLSLSLLPLTFISLLQCTHTEINQGEKDVQNVMASALTDVGFTQV
jgi:hypothetical protein